MAIDKKLAMYYGSISFFTTIIHNIFLLYHVDTFVSIYKINKAAFWIGETIFLVWNSCNDPLFGWLSDKQSLLTSGRKTDAVSKRLQALTWSGPLFALSFLTFWTSWAPAAIQFVICLCLYDGFLTMVDLHHSALLADMAVSGDTRTHLNFYSSLFSAIGSLSVFVSYAVWSKDNLVTFQVFCVILSLISVCGYLHCTKVLKKLYARSLKNEDTSPHDVICTSTAEILGVEVKDKDALRKFVGELLGHSNFVWFAFMNLIQVFHCHFNSNFFPLFLETLLGDEVPQFVCSIILGVSFVAPHINNLYFLSLCRTFGVYAVIRGLFVVKLGLSLLMFWLGPNHLWLLCIYIASNRVFTEGTCKLLTLVISDLVDEDTVVNRRPQAVSALIFGTAALLSKPGQTLAPLVGTWLLAVYTGHDVFSSGNEIGSIKMSLDSLEVSSLQHYRTGVFNLLVYIPIICGLMQLLLWTRFTLHGKRLAWVKSVRSGLPFTTV